MIIWSNFNDGVTMNVEELRQLNKSLRDPDERVRFDLAHRLVWPIPEHLRQHAWLGITDESPVVRLAWVKREDVDWSPSQALHIFNDQDSLVRSVFLNKEPFTEKMVSGGLASRFSYVRETIVSNPKVKLTEKQTDYILADESANVKNALRTRQDFSPTHAQIEKGLKHREFKERRWWAELPNFNPTHQQIEKGVKDHHWKVRVAWARREDFMPTDQMVENGLTDFVDHVRLAWIIRKDVSPTEHQMKRGLLDDSPSVRSAFSAKKIELERINLQSLADRPTIEISLPFKP